MLALLPVLAILGLGLAAPPPYLISELDVGEFRLVEATASAIVCR